jgi:ubiquinone/menaquinone biosynthesis C-methylase UbiE
VIVAERLTSPPNPLSGAERGSRTSILASWRTISGLAGERAEGWWSVEIEAERIKSTNAAYWNNNASRWRGLDLPPEDEVQAVGTMLGCGPGSAIFDAGCGTGQWGVALTLVGYEVRGIDISPGMVAAAQDRAAQHGLGTELASFQVGDLDATGYPDASFDGIMCRLVLDFVPSPGLVLAEFRRILRPGGRLVLWVLGAASPVKRDDWRRFLPGAPGPAVRNQLLPWEAEALLAELGWEIVSQAPGFERSVSGKGNQYSAETVEQLPDRVLQQTVASNWRIVAVKREGHAP